MNILVASREASHPLLDRLVRDNDAHRSGTGDPASPSLVVFDASTESLAAALAAGGTLGAAFASGTPLLLLGLSSDDADVVRSRVPFAPATAHPALLLRSRVGGGGRRAWDIAALLALADGAVPQAQALDRFASRVRERIAEPIADTAYPPGLQYTTAHFSLSVPFLYKLTVHLAPGVKEDVANSSEGTLELNYDVTAFLDVTKADSQGTLRYQQYLTLNAAYSLYAGVMAGNTKKDRLTANGGLKSAVGASGFAGHRHKPDFGVDSWNEALTVDIHYVSPLDGSIATYTWQSTVEQTIPGWSVRPGGITNELGSTWYQSQPCDATNLKDTYMDGWLAGGKGVKPLPDASTNVLTAYEASVWRSDTLQATTDLKTSPHWLGFGLLTEVSGMLPAPSYGEDPHAAEQTFPIDLTAVLPK